VDVRPRQITAREQQMLSVLAEGVMAQVQLQVASRQLVERSNVIERDLRRAVEVQRFLLPEALLAGGGWQIAHTYRPVEHLGGDCLDVQRRGDGSWTVLIADVTGHGTAAALTAVVTKSAFVRAIGAAAPPGEVLMEMNRSLQQVAPPGQFVTAQVMLMHPGADRMLIASAGHPYPLRMDRNGVALVESDGGPPLLVDPQAKYGDTAIEGLGNEDSILFYTDGAIEATDADGRQLEIDGLRAIFEGMRGGTSTSVLEKTLNGVLEHGQGRVHDDVALLLIQRCAGA
jgi:sigma-B regulation protein RsbU (phosphoserine phosphatase)